MDNNKFNEQSKEQLEKEIQELKRQKEIRELQRQKEELEKTMFDSVGGSKAAEKDENTKKKVEKSSWQGNKNMVIYILSIRKGITGQWYRNRRSNNV